MEDDSSTPQSLFPLQTCPQVSDEDFNLFHTIDRELCSHLIHNLGRDPAESVRVMAFWMWLERESSDMNLIKRITCLPTPLVNQLADETVMCMKCVESDKFLFGDRDGSRIKIMSELLNGLVISLQFFHENRIAVLRGVTKMINTVCLRAFNDILQRAWHGNAANVTAESGGSGGPAAGLPVQLVGESSRGGGGALVRPFVPIMYNPLFDVPFVQLHPAIGGGLIRMPTPPQVAGTYRPPPPIHMLTTPWFPAQPSELGEMMSRNLTINRREDTLNAAVAGGEEQEVGPDDRTIFLTFSKGYPTSKNEVREFFTMRFGDFIEDLIMQEVGQGEQALYARMVAKSAEVMDDIVKGNKVKYCINGKHVWARKYIKKL